MRSSQQVGTDPAYDYNCRHRHKQVVANSFAVEFFEKLHILYVSVYA
jgi:hypothetical protein